jgi:hypothetical protein
MHGMPHIKIDLQLFHPVQKSSGAEGYGRCSRMLKR